MSTQTTETTDAAETHTGGETDRQSPARRVLSAVGRRSGTGTPAALAGGALLAAAVRAVARNRRRAGVIALAGAGLLGLGLRRRRTADGTSGAAESTGTHSAEAAAHQTASDLVGRSEANPRDVSGGAVVEAAADEGTIRFSTDQDETGEPRPHLDPDDPGDPRYADEDDPETAGDHVEVSLSETKTTDELGKVAAPDEEQAYPASEGTDPEPMSEKAPQRYGEGAVANKSTGGEESEAGEENEAGEETEADEQSGTGDPTAESGTEGDGARSDDDSE